MCVCMCVISNRVQAKLGLGVGWGKGGGQASREVALLAKAAGSESTGGLVPSSPSLPLTYLLGL